MKVKLIAMTLLVAPLLGFAVEVILPLEPTSTLWVEGGSTVRSWKCAAQKLDGELSVEPAAEIAGLVKRATVAIPVAQLECGNGKMNSHLRKALKADTHPNVQFTLDSYQLTDDQATLNGELTIAGETKPIEIPATVVEETDGVVRVKAAKQINMTEWGVKPPSLMLGTMKVKDAVTVNFDVSMKR